jgi:hypothetical protein
MVALVTGSPVISHSSALTGAITGTAFGVPIRGGKVDTPITVQMVFASAPGASVYQLMGSLDGTNYAPLQVSDGSITLVTFTEASLIIKYKVNVKFVRLDQVSKTNAIQSTGRLMMG